MIGQYIWGSDIRDSNTSETVWVNSESTKLVSLTDLELAILFDFLSERVK